MGKPCPLFSGNGQKKTTFSYECLLQHDQNHHYIIISIIVIIINIIMNINIIINIL